jgi:hypothetical protein
LHYGLDTIPGIKGTESPIYLLPHEQVHLREQQGSDRDLREHESERSNKRVGEEYVYGEEVVRQTKLSK